MVYTDLIMGRVGAFAANFKPEVLDAFRALCKKQGKQYTKVLEQLAEIYLQRGGDIEILGSVKAPINPKSTAPEVVQATQQLLRRVDRLEENEEFNAETFTELLNRIEQLEQIPKTKKQSTQKRTTTKPSKSKSSK